MSVPVYSLSALISSVRNSSPEGDVLLAEFDASLRDPGAFRLVDVPVTNELLEAMHGVTAAFFGLPFEDKVTYRYADDQYVGWCGGEFLSQYGSKDHKEMFHIGPRVAATLPSHDVQGMTEHVPEELREEAIDSCSLWPAAPEDFIPVWHKYYEAMQETAALLGVVLAHLLDVSDTDWFAVLGENWADLAANYYPPVVAESGSPAPVYNAPHKDLTIFTVLYQDASPVGGLSVQSMDGSWQSAEPVPGSYIVNVGELLTYLSGGRWRAAPHQVTVRADAPAQTKPRISIPFFYRPNDGRVVTSFVDPDATPIAVGDWVLEKKRASVSK